MKIYAKTLNPEHFDYRVYDISDDDYNQVIIDGGREFCNIDNNDELKIIKRLINDYNDYDLDVYYEGSIKAYIKDMLYPLKKANGKDFSPREIHIINELILDYNNDSAIKTILSILHGEEYICRVLRGCCQGDVVYAYAPKREEKYLEWVEAWYFGTGTEVMIHDEDNEPKDADDISGYTFYTSAWNDEDLLNEIREYTGAKDADEIILWKYSGTNTIYIDHYELANC